MLNFCNAKLAEIECNNPSCDGYSVTNLISTNADRKKGFLVDYFVKPPVEIQLKFSCSVNVKKVNLNCAVGLQKSKVVQILSETKDDLRSVVGKGAVEGSEKHLVFYIRGNQKDNHGKHEEFFNTKNLFNVKHLIVKILHTEGSTVPALGSLEVWGCISRNVPKSKKKSILKLWRNIQLHQNNHENSFSDNLHVIKEVKLSKKKEDVQETFKIPDEFLDPISCDIFTMPMMLPSGNVVDINTLKKFYEAEARWGRGESDPFTGIPFTDASKPVVATSLRERLDKFLLKNCNMPLVKNLPRTVGRGIKQTVTMPNETSSYLFSASVSYELPNIAKRKFRDIDSLLEQSLSGLPTYLEKPVIKKPKVECMKCNKVELLFKLLCDHFICRHCLVLMDRSENNKCICNEKISFNDVIRYHINL